MRKPRSHGKKRRKNLRRDGIPRKREKPIVSRATLWSEAAMVGNSRRDKRMRGTRPRFAENLRQNGGATRVRREKSLERTKLRRARGGARRQNRGSRPSLHEEQKPGSCGPALRSHRKALTRRREKQQACMVCAKSRTVLMAAQSSEEHPKPHERLSIKNGNRRRAHQSIRRAAQIGRRVRGNSGLRFTVCEKP